MRKKGNLAGSLNCPEKVKAYRHFCNQLQPDTLPRPATLYSTMWLDRFSTQSTPAPSPPRDQRSAQISRPSAQYSRNLRPGLNPRDSTVSLLSNGSTANLPTIAHPRGSGLRNQLDAKPGEDVSDPLKALEDIVGKALHDLQNTTSSPKSKEVEAPGDLVADIDFGGLSLQDFVAENNVISTSSDVPTYVEQSVDECMWLTSALNYHVVDAFLDDLEKEKFRNLHKSIVVRFLISLDVICYSHVVLGL